MKSILFYIVFAVTLIIGVGHLQWWRCGEMFPHAQFACFVGGGR